MMWTEVRADLSSSCGIAQIMLLAFLYAEVCLSVLNIGRQCTHAATLPVAADRYIAIQRIFPASDSC